MAAINKRRVSQPEQLPADPRTRRSAIRTIIRNHMVATQEDLRELLAKQGFDVTQATLSRDLAQIGARRVSRPEGGTAYEVDDARVPDGQELLFAFRDMVSFVTPTDSLVIIGTTPGAASAVALGLDRVRLPEIAGTLAGDDTIFVAPAKGIAPGRLARQLSSLWKGTAE